jgi:phenylpropionate dioxygenase-like ring-hydroxylating dioxygenase large terminal subunit
MFQDFEDVWSPVLLSKQLGRRPRQATLAGVKLALYRDPRGVAHALADVCPHRGVSLSLGSVEGDCLACPFHGWQFAADGACREIPFNPMSDEKRERYRAAAFPVAERGGLLFVFTGEAAHPEAKKGPSIDEAMISEGVSRSYYFQDWDCHWTRAMENMLDSPHLPFVHRKTIGRFVRKNMTPGCKMNIAVSENESGFKTTSLIDEQPDEGAFLQWRRPNAMTLNIPIPNKLWHMNVWCVPLEHNRTRMILASARTFMRHNPLGFFLDLSNRKILGEDRAVVESSFPSEVPPAAQERSVATDRATLAFRKYYYEQLKKPTETRQTFAA